jgi:hypothetical protein
MADRDGHAFGHIRLPPVSGAELHRDRRVEHEPRDEHALREIDAHMRLAGARRDVPVDPAHVVAGDVGTHHRELGARPQEIRSEVAREQALDTPPHRDVERAEEPFRHRAGARACRRRSCEKRAGVPHACLMRR